MKRTSLAILGLCALAFSPLTAVRPANAQTVSCTGVAAWSGNSVSYAVGALVTYSGSEYKCLQAHTSNPSWDPVDAASLWSKQGTCSTGATCAASPSAPSGLTASGTTSTGTTLSWTAVTPPSNCTVTSYTIYKSGTSIGTSTSTSFAVTGLTAGTTYTFTVAATDSIGTGSQSSSVSVATSSASCSTKPNAPTGLAASGTSSTGTTLSWSAVSAPSNCSISGYTIYKAGTSIGTSTGTSFAVTGLTASTTYAFTVAATDASGTGSASSSLSVTTSAAGSGCYAAWVSTTAYSTGNQVSYNGVNYTAAFWSQGSIPSSNSGPSGSGEPWVSNGSCSGGGGTCSASPSAPTGLSASGTTQTGTTLSWSAVTAPSNCSISSYTIYKSGASIGTTTGTSFAVTGLSASTAYTFTVAATDSFGTGSQSSSVSVTTLANTCTTKPSSPSGLAASGTTSSGTTLNWSTLTPPSGCTITGYTIYQGSAAIATVSVGTSYAVGNLQPSTTYTFTIAANDGAGTGTQSSSVSVTTLANTGAKGKVIGYWETWASLTLLNAATDYDVIELAFAQASGADGQTQAMPATTESTTQIQSDITTLHGQGKKVLISVGGANTYTIKLENASDESAFVTSVEGIVDSFHLDGVDLDIENNNLALNAGDTDINNPTTPSTVYMIQALSDLRTHYGSSFMVTMAPQVADTNCSGHPLGNDGAGLYWGSFLPLINKARANITYVMVQDYNASQMYEKDGVSVVNQGTPDFDVAMSDLLLSGYKIFGTGQQFPAINANQVVVGTPAVTAAAGSGYNTPTAVDQVVNYIKFGTSYGGAYSLGATYPNLGGVMTWDCNYDYNAGDPMAGAVMADVHR